jgi:hypothetical protein
LRRVAEQGARVARQKKTVATLKANGAGTYAAEQLLVTMEDTLTSLRATLIRYPK